MKFFDSIFQIVERNIFILQISITVKDWNFRFLVALLINTTRMLLTRAFVNVCNTMYVTSVSSKLIRPKSQVLFPQLSLCKDRLGEMKRGFAAESSPDTHDLVVEHLDGENSGIVVFGLNRPKV